MELHKKKSDRQKWNDGVPLVGEPSASDDEYDDPTKEKTPKQRPVSNADDMAFLKSKKVTKLTGEDSGDDEEEQQPTEVTQEKKQYKYGVLPTVKIRGLPLKCKKSKVKQFFAPLKPFHVRMAKGVKGIAYVVFKKAEDIPKALNKHRSFIG